MTRQLEDDFFFDMDRLNVQRPDAVLRVTEHMDEIVRYVERLVGQGDAYVSEDGVYFSVAQMKGEYDQFGLNLGQSQTVDTESASTVESSAFSEVLIPEPIVPDAPSHCKRDPRDFALWKLAKKIDTLGDCIDSAQFEQPHWASPWGVGRPGWHIECSAMTQAHFGPHIDIHSGGVDLQFPHHTNEIAQW
jgi:cysteinyl-tRNA synthetase